MDYLIVDLPPGTGDVQISLTQMLQVSGTVVVTTPQSLSVSDVRKAISMWQIPALNVPIFGIVENMSYFKSPEGKEHFLFGKGGGELLEKETGFSLLSKIPIFEPREQNDNSLVTENKDLLSIYSGLVGKIVSSIAIKNNDLKP